MMALLRRPSVLLAVGVAFSAGLSACGGSSPKSSSTKSTSTPTTTGPAAVGGTSSVTSGPVRATLVGKNHAPTVNQSWRYSVRVSDASGHPLAGTVDIQFAFAGQVVGRDTPPTHPIRNGRWQDSLKFPPDAIGKPLTFRAVVHTSQGSITLDWPITVR